ncbi:MAG TPA: GNAT family N-acetyltransferase, partial [Ktedonobacterales bacterium]
MAAGHQAREAGTAFPFAMVQTDDAVVVGCMALRVVSEHRRGELGYWVGHAFRGHGYATEAAARLIAFGFDDLALNRIE